MPKKTKKGKISSNLKTRNRRNCPELFQQKNVAPEPWRIKANGRPRSKFFIPPPPYPNTSTATLQQTVVQSVQYTFVVQYNNSSSSSILVLCA